MLNYPPSIDALVDTLFDDDVAEGSKNKTFSIRVIKYFEDKSSINWVIKRTSDEFLENHHHLVKKLGLLKSFSFSSSHKMFSFHSKHSLDSSHVNEYLKELTLLNPIPLVVVTFLALENIELAMKANLVKKDSMNKGDSGRRVVTSLGSDHNMSNIEDSPLPRSSTHVDTHDLHDFAIHHPEPHKRSSLHPRPSWKGPKSTSDIRHHSWHDFVHCADQDRIARYCLWAVFFAFLHSLLKGAWYVAQFVGFLDDSSFFQLRRAVIDYVKASLLRLRYFLEGVVLTLLAMAVIHKLFGFLAGWRFRRKLKTHIDGRYNVHFGAICFRMGAGKNQVVFSNFEWRNPPLFDQTPYFIHIDDITFTFDLVSLYDAFFRHKSIKVYEICINNCNVYIEKKKIPGKGSTGSSGDVGGHGDSGKHLSVDSGGSSTHSSSTGSAGGGEYRLNMWAAVGKQDYSELRASASSSSSTAGATATSGTTAETSRGLSRSSSRNSFFSTSGPSDRVSVSGGNAGRSVSVDHQKSTGGGSEAVNRLREELLQTNTLSNSGKLQLGSGGGSSIGGGGAGLRKSTSMHKLSGGGGSGSEDSSTSKAFRRHSSHGHGLASLFHHKKDRPSLVAERQEESELVAEESSSSKGGGGLKRVDSTYSIHSADSFSDMAESGNSKKTGAPQQQQQHHEDEDFGHFDLMDDESEHVRPSESFIHSSTGGGGGSAGKRVHIDTSATEPRPAPRLSENELAYLKNKRLFGFPYRLDINTLVFKNLQMHISDLLNASHVDHSHCSTIKLATLVMSHEELTKPPSGHGHHRKGVYMDEVMWRTVNCAMNELLKSNKVTLLSIFASAAANQTAAAVRQMAKRLFKSGKE